MSTTVSVPLSEAVEGNVDDPEQTLKLVRIQKSKKILYFF